MFIRIPDNGNMAAVTLIWVLFMSVKNPEISPVENGALRFLESAIGVSVGILIAWGLNRFYQINSDRKSLKKNN